VDPIGNMDVAPWFVLSRQWCSHYMKLAKPASPKKRETYKYCN